ncbi:PHP domain-containing protein [Thalassotalea sp. LPB0316]|uniref:PHP domain-containing protein n=1 Tax=Thalassotalea sp. LPB0316 TaxID=2769490 RepID=UPI001868F5BE|nr:PHP domain-containing protein [Thalassotalea sp. LPB0316]QOL24680.1 PHP domain-containing protein [Thalassotalea sp. LPB0316]
MSTASIQLNRQQRIDLHSHTTCSDGKFTATELVDRAVNFQLDVLAITDHDSIDALASAKSYIQANQLPLKIINGVEISTRWHGFEIHIVGLNFDPNNSALNALLEQQAQAREERAINMAVKLEKCGFVGIYDDAKQLAKDGTITRSHFAQALYNRGEISKLQSAFDKYIGKNKRAFVKSAWCDLQTAIETIHQAGGSAVMAHPIRYDMSGKWRRKLIIEFKSLGGDALEIVLPQMNPDQRRLMLSYCQEYELKASLGSDFHYPTPWSDLGKNLTLPEDCIEVWSNWDNIHP